MAPSRLDTAALSRVDRLLLHLIIITITHHGSDPPALTRLMLGMEVDIHPRTHRTLRRLNSTRHPTIILTRSRSTLLHHLPLPLRR